jgi:uncharacterized protein YegL
MDDEVFLGVRRLPVYLLVDCSESMAGKPITDIEMSIKTLLYGLLNDPQALDTIWLSIITFNDNAEVVVPLMEISMFEMPLFTVSGSTLFGKALELLTETINKDVVKSTEYRKGDFKPMVFVYTDGHFKDNWEKPVGEFRKKNLCSIMGCSTGQGADDNIIQSVTKTVVNISDTCKVILGNFVHHGSICFKKKESKSEDLDLPPLPKSKGIQIIP